MSTCQDQPCGFHGPVWKSMPHLIFFYFLSEKYPPENMVSWLALWDTRMEKYLSEPWDEKKTCVDICSLQLHYFDQRAKSWQTHNMDGIDVLFDCSKIRLCLPKNEDNIGTCCQFLWNRLPAIAFCLSSSRQLPLPVHWINKVVCFY